MLLYKALPTGARGINFAQRTPLGSILAINRGKKMSSASRNGFIEPMLLAVALCLSLLQGCGQGVQGTTSLGVELSQGNAQVLDELLSDTFKADEPGATVFVSHRGATILRKGYGLADIELGVALEPQMVFRIGSITKTFTALAIVKMAEASKLELGDSVRKYLTELPERFEPITLEHLLSHTSGIPDYIHTEAFDKLLNDEYQNIVGEEIELGKMLRIITDGEFEFEPGERFSYSNSNYFLLAMVIEAVGGKPYFDTIKSLVCEPCGMQHTYYIGNSIRIPGRVPDHLEFEGRIIKDPHRCIGSTLGFGYGGLWSNIDDLALLDRAFFSGQLVSREWVERMTTPFVPSDGSTSRFGLGWQIKKLKNREMVYHGGDYLDYSSIILRLPNEDIFVAILTNDGRLHSGHLETLAKMMAAILMDDPFPQWQAIELSKEELLRFAGVYRIDDDNTREVIDEDGKIYTRRNNGAKIEISPADKTTFFYQQSLSYLTFDVDEQGIATRMLMHRDTGEIEVAEKER